jgi:hypothetical protein
MGPTGTTGVRVAIEVLRTACVAPVLESYVSMDASREQGLGVEVEAVSEMLPRISPRLPGRPASENARVTVTNCPDPTVKGIGVPISPFALKNEIVPAQEGAKTALALLGDAAVAVFTTVIEAVSLAARPTGAKTLVRVKLAGAVVPCAHTGEKAPQTAAARTCRDLRQSMVHLFREVGRNWLTAGSHQL